MWVSINCMRFESLCVLRQMMHILTRPTLEINLNKILDNYKILQKLAAGAEAAAVVKDDAYGIGAEQVVKKLYTEGECNNFFVAHAEEGAQIRPLAPQAKIFVLQGIGEDSRETIIKNKLIPVISSPAMFAFWKKSPIAGIKPVIHIDTGLNRLGFREKELQKLTQEDCQSFCMVMSHLACGDAKAHFMNKLQLDNFQHLKQQYFKGLPASLSASDGVFLGKDFHFDMVRLGAAMYGINTAPYRENQMTNAVRITAPVLQVADLPQGEFVGYSATYRANSQRRIAIVSIGYGDGMPRSLSNVGKVYFETDKLHEARMIGRISMDNIICDVTDIPDLTEGETAILVDDFYTLDDLGRDAGTIAYEIISRIGRKQRFKKIYIGE